MNRASIALTTVALLCGAEVSHAITLEFSGTGLLCSYGDTTNCNPSDTRDFTGRVTYSIQTALPTGDDSYIDTGPGYEMAQDDDGWVISDFLFRWDGGQFAVTPSDTQRHYTFLQNGLDPSIPDLAQMREIYSETIGGALTIEYAELALFTSSSDWLTSLAFPETFPAGLTGSAAFSSTFADGGPGLRNGFVAELDVSSVRIAQIPEPASLALFALGVAGLFGSGRRVARITSR